MSLQDACHVSLQDACHVFSEGGVPTGETLTSFETKIENDQIRQQTIEKVDTNKKEKCKLIKKINNRDTKYINS